MSKPIVSAFDNLVPSSVVRENGKKRGESALGRGGGTDWLTSLADVFHLR